MTNQPAGAPQTPSTATSLGIEPHDRVRLIGDLKTGETVLGTLPEGVIMNSVSSIAAQVGILIVDDENDLRARLNTELSGLTSARAVWVLSNITTGGPDSATVTHDTETLSWTTGDHLDLESGWTAISLRPRV